MAQWVKTLVTKPENQSGVIPDPTNPHSRRRELTPTNVLWPPHSHDARRQAHTNVHANKPIGGGTH